MFINDAQCGAMTYRSEWDVLVRGLAVTVVRRRELRDRDSQGQGRFLPHYIRNRTSFRGPQNVANVPAAEGGSLTPADDLLKKPFAISAKMAYAQ
jgi:hypothetical protein